MVNFSSIHLQQISIVNLSSQENISISAYLSFLSKTALSQSLSCFVATDWIKEFQDFVGKVTDVIQLFKRMIEASHRKCSIKVKARTEGDNKGIEN